MDLSKYIEAVDSVKFKDGFEQDTIELMRHAAQCKHQKEYEKMKTRKILKISAMVAAITAILTITAFALTTLLTPKEVATKSGYNVLAGAFDSKDAININKSEKAGEYTITLHGIVSGKGLVEYDQATQSDKSYIVASVAYTDGRKITQAGQTEMTFSPLISGYNPRQVNAWTLKGGYSSFVHEGVNYFVFSCEDLEIFADHTVYLAAYEGGGVPGPQIFKLSENGEISFASGFDKPHALFTIPLDPKKANPEAAKKLLDSISLFK